MFSANSDSKYRNQSITDMNNTFLEQSPDFSAPRTQARRLADLDIDIQTWTIKKPRSTMKNLPSMSVTKPIRKKTAGLSQNMSTSKKLVIQKKSNNNVVKRSIDFSSALKGELHNHVKNDVKNSRFSTAHLSAPFVNSHANEKRTTAIFPMASTAGQYSTNNFTVTNTVSNTLENRPKTPKSAKKNSPKYKTYLENIAELSGESNKENSSSYSNSATSSTKSNKTKSKTPHKKVLCNEDLKELVENNSKILASMMSLMTNLYDNNKKLLNLISDQMSESDGKWNVSSTLTSKQLNFESTNEGNNREQWDGFVKPSNDLRKVALWNNEMKKEKDGCKDVKKTALWNNDVKKDRNGFSYNRSPLPKLKRSAEMYAEMKSNMKFLKTPKKNGDHQIAEVETPNTRNMSMVSANLQHQLEKLFDSPTEELINKV